jgi:hypothetical protein
MTQPRSNLEVQFETFNYRHAEEILNAHKPVKDEILAVVKKIQPGAATRGAESLHSRILSEFVNLGWRKEVPIVETEQHQERLDLLKAPVGIEVTFNRQEMLYRDYLRFIKAESSGKIEVGVLITREVGRKSYEPSFVYVQSQLDALRQTITVPIWVIGLR